MDIWIGTNVGAFVYNGIALKSFTTAEGIASNLVNSIVLDDRSRTWLGTGSGLSVLENGTWVKLFTTLAIYYLLKDSTGNIWIGTATAGILLFQNSDQKFYQFFDSACSGCNTVNWIIEDKEKSIWFATAAGLRRLKANQFTRFTTTDGLLANYVISLFQDSAGTIWISTLNNTGSLNRYRNGQFEKVVVPNGSKTNWIYAFAEDQYRNLWMSTVSNGLVKFDGALMQEVFWPAFKTAYTDIFKDNNGDIWIGTDRRGVGKYILPLPN